VLALHATPSTLDHSLSYPKHALDPAWNKMHKLPSYIGCLYFLEEADHYLKFWFIRTWLLYLSFYSTKFTIWWWRW
jgi:hypothetical protein